MIVLIFALFSLSLLVLQMLTATIRKNNINVNNTTVYHKKAGLWDSDLKLISLLLNVYPLLEPRGYLTTDKTYFQDDKKILNHQ